MFARKLFTSVGLRVNRLPKSNVFQTGNMIARFFSDESRIDGTVKFFDSAKGFGFITPSNGSDDVFVHWSELQLDGFKVLNESEQVQYTLGEDPNRPGKLFAKQVTGPNGGKLQGGRPQGGGGGGGRGGGGFDRRGGGGGGNRFSRDREDY